MRVLLSVLMCVMGLSLGIACTCAGEFSSSRLNFVLVQIIHLFLVENL